MAVHSTRIIALALMSASLATPAAADIVAPSTYTSIEGGAAQTLPFGNAIASDLMLQTAYSASALGGMTAGTVITGIGFRLNGAAVAPLADLVYSDFTVRIGTSAVPLGALTGDFTANYGADTIVARTGALTVATGSFVASAGPNPFFTINFANAYTYTGGTLLLTLDATRTDGGVAVPIDAIAVGGGLTDTVGVYGANDPLLHFYNAPVVQLQTAAAVPEASSWALMLVGFCTVGGLARSRNAKRRAFA